MDTITVICPKCHHQNTIATPSRHGGHVTCAECSHAFKVVPKIRAGKIRKAVHPAHTQTDIPDAEEVMSALSSMLTHTHQQHERKTTHSPTATPMPGSNSPSINTLLGEPSHTPTTTIGAPPTATITPTIIDTTQLSQSVPAVAPMADTGSGNTVNNLVFTLLPAQEQPKIQADVPLLLNDTIEKTEEISANQQRLYEQQTRLHKEFNWTLASLVALTVLIIQLFYLMAVK